jgi:hypothetical protein
MPHCFAMPVPKFVMPALKSVKNTQSMAWNIANVALKHAGNVPKNAARWQE